jgi:hypothetical protein
VENNLMTADPVPEDDVKIYSPTYALRKKIGNANLDQILTPKVIEAAQEVIVNSAGQMIDEVFSGMKELDQAARALKTGAANEQTLITEIVALAFAVKTKAGLGGYDLVARIAKSLQLFCEQLESGELTAKNRELIIWHIGSINQLLALKTEGLGGALGEEILAELAKVEQRP